MIVKSVIAQLGLLPLVIGLKNLMPVSFSTNDKQNQNQLHLVHTIVFPAL